MVYLHIKYSKDDVITLSLNNIILFDVHSNVYVGNKIIKHNLNCYKNDTFCILTMLVLSILFIVIKLRYIQFQHKIPCVSKDSFVLKLLKHLLVRIHEKCPFEYSMLSNVCYFTCVIWFKLNIENVSQ